MVPDPTSSPISLPILPDITSARLAHGLKHGDYLRYRRYCTRRLSRTRATTSLSQRAASTPQKYVSVPPTPDAARANPRALTIPLIQAERAWAHAMDVKTQVPSGAARARRVTLSKLRKAVKYAGELKELCKVVADEGTVLEAEAYSRGMWGALRLEEDNWGEALKEYEVAYEVYVGMAGVRVGTSGAGVYEKRVEEVGQAMRFCRYHLGRGGEGELREGLRGGDDGLREKIERALGEARKRAAVSFGEVEWCGIKVMLRAEKVREAVLMVEEEHKLFKGHKVDEYDKLFMVYHDAIKVVSAELAEFRKSGAAEARVRELELLVAYLSYGRLMRTAERNLLLIESFKAKRNAKPEDFVRLYDNLISNMSDILGLAGVDTDAEISNEAESRCKVFRAYRCFHLAQCYLAVELQNEAAALFDRVSVHASALTGKYADEAAKIVAESTGMKCRAKAQAFLKAHEGHHAIGMENGHRVGAQKKRLVDNLDTFESFAGGKQDRRVVCDMPPALEAVPCKPVLFDLAIDGVRFPEDKVEDIVLEEPAVEKKAAATTSSFQPLSSTRLGRWWSGRG